MNNPTIDGVSLELLESFAVYVADSPNAIMRARAATLRALLDADHTGDSNAMVAPAVERQDLKAVARVCGAGYDEKGSTVWMEIGVEEMPISRRVELGENLVFMADAQSTIAQLQARIAELENGRGEPVAWMYKREGGTLGQLVAMESDDLKNIRLGKCYDDGTRYMWPREDYIEWKPLYTAPPAPVAVVLPERKTFSPPSYRDGHADGWNSCLDATAALNEGRQS